MTFAFVRQAGETWCERNEGECGFEPAAGHLNFQCHQKTKDPTAGQEIKRQNKSYKLQKVIQWPRY